MTTTSLRSVRYAFIMFLLALTAFTVVESAVGGRAVRTAAADEGLSTCGTLEQPCTLEMLAVTVDAPEPAPVQLAAEEGLSACGTEEQPCRLEAVEVTATAATGRLASTERSVGMALRVRS